MPPTCCVPKCKETGGFLFPKNKDLRKKWQVAIKRENRRKQLWKPSDHSVVCHKHFETSDFLQPKVVYGEKRRKILKEDAVPSLFEFRPITSELSARKKRYEQRTRSSHGQSLLLESLEDSTANLVDFVNEVVITEDEESQDNAEETSQPEDHQELDKETQCNFLQPPNLFQCWRISLFAEQSQVIQYYTGFLNYDHYQFFFHCLGPAAHELNYKSSILDPQDELFLCLVKLRQCKEDEELAILFGLSKSSVGRVFRTWLNFLYFQLKELDLWVDSEITQQHMPAHFKKSFPDTRVIIDATEIPIEKPSNIRDQSASFSTYKNKNTLKCLIGIAPRGLVTFVSDAFGGCTSDRQILERSPLLSDRTKFAAGESIMADRGFQVQDLFASSGVTLNIPTTMKGKNQLDPATVVGDRRIASKRVHVERIIGYTKTFKILVSPLRHSYIALGSRILAVCFAISNFRVSIVKDYC